MYTTIEADIENGRIIGPESRKLPAAAHVLITLLPFKVEKKSARTPHNRVELMARFAGAWQGDALVREDQGKFDLRPLLSANKQQESLAPFWIIE
jgi:hypothetical protein